MENGLNGLQWAVLHYYISCATSYVPTHYISYQRVLLECGNQALYESALSVDLLRHVSQDEHLRVQLVRERASKKV